MNRTIVAVILINLFLTASFIYLYESKSAGLEAELHLLKDRLAYLEPAYPSVIQPALVNAAPIAVQEVMTQGKNLGMRTLELNETWIRPVYIPLWHSKAWDCGRFCYVPRLIEYNRHRVFIYQGGGSYWFDLAPSMSFTDETSPVGVSFKRADEVAIIALEARIREIKKLNGQLCIVVEPARNGYHIAALAENDYRGCQSVVVTPEGFELEVPVNSFSSGSYQ